MSSGPRSVMIKSSSHGVSRLPVMVFASRQHMLPCGAHTLGYEPALPMFENVTVPPSEAAPKSMPVNAPRPPPVLTGVPALPAVALAPPVVALVPPALVPPADVELPAPPDALVLPP